MNCFKYFFLILFFFYLGNILAQSKLSLFLEPSDSLNKLRLTTLLITESTVATATLIGLETLWYNDYPKSSFHFINDNSEWLQMDKAGHVFSSYHIGRLGSDALKWSGANKKSQLIYGATLGFVFLNAVEVFDGYSSEWGASLGDVAANFSGTALYVSQELLWKEQKIIPKFSFHTTPYAAVRPNVLGKSLNEQILKDYNGQTYWLSANVHSFFKDDIVPKWVNIAVGYGAEGMITGNEVLINTIFLPEKSRTRQYYLSLDVDLSKIKTKSSVLRTIFSVLNTIKIPAPTFEINGRGITKWHIFYF